MPARHSSLRIALAAAAMGLGVHASAAAPEAAMGGMPMAGMSHGTGGACKDAKLACASTVTPTLAADGSLWLAFDVDNKVYVTHSTDRGRNFSTPVAITPEKVHLDNGPDARSSITLDGQGRIFVSYAIFKDNNYNAEVFFSRSTDKGRSFSAPTPLVDNTASQRFAALAVSPNGDLFATWLDKRGVVAAAKQGKTYAGAALGYAWSKDGGAHFTPSRIALDNTCECCRIGVGFNGPDQPVVVFRNVFGGTVRDHAILSFRDADTPGPMRRVAVDNWHLNGCPHQGPSLSIAATGAYHVVWSTQGDARKGLFYARSTDKGVHFSEPMTLGNQDHERSRPYVTAVPGAVWIVWKEFDGENSVVNARVSHDDGATWSPVRTAAKTEDASDHPMLVNDGHKAYLSWMTKTDGYRFIPLEDKS
ncbi:MAG TPA: sialidase family protein [Rhizomicrobium sp.]